MIGLSPAPSWLAASARHPAHWLVLQVICVMLLISVAWLVWDHQKGGDPDG